MDIPIKVILEIKFGEKGFQKEDSGSICQASVVIDFVRVGGDRCVVKLGLESQSLMTSYAAQTLALLLSICNITGSSSNPNDKC